MVRGGDGTTTPAALAGTLLMAFSHQHHACTMPPAIFRCHRREEASCRGSASTMERADPAGSLSSQNLTASVAGDTNILTATLSAEGQ